MSKEPRPSAGESSVQNVYTLDGKVPIGTAIPFGLQHVLAMFVSNLVPVILVTGVAIVKGKGGDHLEATEVATLLQCAMLVAGVGTLIQCYPIGPIGAKLPVVMGVSFTFLAALMSVATNPEWGYEGMMGAIIVGGCIEGILGLLAKYWKRVIPPIVSACVVTAIGMSLLGTGMNSFGGGQGAEDFGAWYNLVIALITLVSCLVWKYLAKGPMKSLNVLFGVAVGYIASIIFTLTGIHQMIDFSQMSATISERGVFSVPMPMFFKYFPEFHPGAIITVVVVFLVSAAETIGDTTTICVGGLGRDITDKEVRGSLCVDGFCSAISGLFGCNPITSFSQNVGLVAMTKVVNRFAISMGALVLVAASLFPPIGAFFNSLPQPVLGGCTVMMFGSIMFSGMQMISRCGFSDRNMVIVALGFAIGVGATNSYTGSTFFAHMPQLIGDIFASNIVAGVFVVTLILSWVLPREKAADAKTE